MGQPSGDGKGRPVFSLTAADPYPLPPCGKPEVKRMTIRSTPHDEGSGDPAVAEWRLDASITFVTGPEVRRFTLRRTPWGWDLTLHDYDVLLDDSIRTRVHGLSLAWSAPAEFWRWIDVIEDHDVDRADIIEMLRAAGDPVLDALADALVGAWGRPIEIAGA
jgi:hypothetical protein